MNRQLAAQLARYAELAYSPVAKVREFHPSADIELIDVDDSQALFFQWDDVAVVACRGTQFSENFSWADVKTNILQGKTDWYGGTRVHGGYAEAARDLIPQVGLFVRKNQLRHIRVYCTGHSLGGVLATLLTSAFDFEATYTFGAPRCGNRAFVKSLKGKDLYRFVYENDIAPAYPSPLWGYRHAGERWQVFRNNSAWQGGDRRDLYHVGKSFGAHEPQNYSKHLKPQKERAF